jgi:hypothetical protein
MPAGYAHLMITAKALDAYGNDENVEEKLRGYALAKSHFVNAGSVGPDYPYLDFLQPSQKKWADHMHYDFTGNLIVTMARTLLKRAQNGIEKELFNIPFCWFLGYISHVTADLVVHPVVFNIVGPYVGHEPEHRHCEMIQDAFIYNKVRNGAEIEHSTLIKLLKNCSDPVNDDDIHPVLREFWKETLSVHFPGDYQHYHPSINEWHDEFEDWLGIAGKPTFVGRILDPAHKFTYKTSTEITGAERKSFLNNLPLPNGKQGDYETDVFPKAIKEVLRKWVSFSKGISGGNLDEFVAGISNCDLDTGRDIVTSRLIYW